MRASDVLRSFRIFHRVMTVMVAAGGGVAYALLERHPKYDPMILPPMDGKLLLGLLGVVAIGVLVAIPIVRRASMPPLANASEAVATDAEIDNYVLPIIVKLRLALTRIWSLCLSLAILGALAAYQLADFRAYIPFGALSFAALMVTRPTAVLFSRALAGPAPPR